MQFKIGDLVRIKHNDEISNCKFGFNNEMEHYSDLQLIISDIVKVRCISTNTSEDAFIFENPPEGMTDWTWGDDMLELISRYSPEEESKTVQKWRLFMEQSVTLP